MKKKQDDERTAALNDCSENYFSSIQDAMLCYNCVQYFDHNRGHILLQSSSLIQSALRRSLSELKNSLNTNTILWPKGDINKGYVHCNLFSQGQPS